MENSSSRTEKSNTNVSEESSLRQRSINSRRSLSLSRMSSSDRVLSSIRLSHELSDQLLADVDSSAIAQIGDSGDRVVDELGTLKDEDKLAKVVCDEGFTVSPLPEEPILTKETEYKLPHRLDYFAYLIHLSVFGFLGVFTRYLLQKLFGPGHLALTSDQTPLYLDLPSNILGSFLMGWFGIVFKPELRQISEHLTIGITTGYMGSLTTFSGWNQKMLLLSSKGHWMFAIAGMLLGIFIVNESITIGVESAEGFQKLIKFRSKRIQINTKFRNIAFLLITLLILISIWVLSGILAVIKVHNLSNGGILWLGLLVAPPGVWIRWYLARLNGVGFGKKEILKWFPIGTFLANVCAACIMASLSVISKAVNTERSGVILSGIQLGFLGCMSTVSTFVAEIYTLRQSGHSGRAFIYAASTILFSFVLGTLIYSVPVWTKHYH
ncbi:hypothetical protein LUZ60_014359 [Juncus effusus]|nr:hypothetical protein LUZ60_014359 [Juncus effusus]